MKLAARFQNMFHVRWSVLASSVVTRFAFVRVVLEECVIRPGPQDNTLFLSAQEPERIIPRVNWNSILLCCSSIPFFVDPVPSFLSQHDLITDHPSREYHKLNRRYPEKAPDDLGGGSFAKSADHSEDPDLGAFQLIDRGVRYGVEDFDSIQQCGSDSADIQSPEPR